MMVSCWVESPCWIEKLGLGLTAFVLIKTQHHSSEWYCRFVTEVTGMPEVLGFWRMAGEYDYLMRVGSPI